MPKRKAPSSPSVPAATTAVTPSLAARAEEAAPASARPTLPLSKYERVRVIGSRANQIARGAKPLVHVGGVLDPLLVAEEEFRLGLLKSIVVRTLPDGTEERCPLATLRTS